MKSYVLEKTKFIVTNSWVGLLLPAGVHQLISLATRNSENDRPAGSQVSHPAEFRINRNVGSRNRP